MAGYKDERFEYVFDMMCKKTVELNRIEREIKTLRFLINELETKSKMELFSNTDKVLKSLTVYRKSLINMEPKRDKLKRDYEYYYNLYLAALDEKCDEALNSALLVFTNKEVELQSKIAELQAYNASSKEIGELKELLKVYYENIESMYFFIDSRNDLKKRFKIPR